MGALKLNVPTYEDVEADTSATTQALTVVVASALLSGVGAAIAASMSGVANSNPVGALIGGVISALVSWAVWSFVVFFVGTKMFGGTATYGELLRTLGFAYAPAAFGVLSFVPVAGPLISLAVGIWGIVAGFVGARQALDISNGKTVAVILIGIIAMAIVLFVIGLVLAAIGLGGAMLTGGLR